MVVVLVCRWRVIKRQVALCCEYTHIFKSWLNVKLGSSHRTGCIEYAPCLPINKTYKWENTAICKLASTGGRRKFGQRSGGGLIPLLTPSSLGPLANMPVLIWSFNTPNHLRKI
ncbi:hypothetical protein E2C01_019813 [Portunus trituberculatus]|uniref:Uncharacterized protein n=1 Tax=Portunus trituberculatus TaxID=210409 RepID=A0A5B7E0F3_PORTR|nr:hypothetical protein [Portunus trituberculatus]